MNKWFDILEFCYLGKFNLHTGRFVEGKVRLRIQAPNNKLSNVALWLIDLIILEMGHGSKLSHLGRFHFFDCLS